MDEKELNNKLEKCGISKENRNNFIKFKSKKGKSGDDNKIEELINRAMEKRISSNNFRKMKAEQKVIMEWLNTTKGLKSILKKSKKKNSNNNNNNTSETLYKNNELTNNSSGYFSENTESYDPSENLRSPSNNTSGVGYNTPNSYDPSEKIIDPTNNSSGVGYNSPNTIKKN